MKEVSKMTKDELVSYAVELEIGTEEVVSQMNVKDLQSGINTVLENDKADKEIAKRIADLEKENKVLKAKLNPEDEGPKNYTTVSQVNGRFNSKIRAEKAKEKSKKGK